MFSYYGSKSKIIGLYPKPKFDLIIEPFAGSARYALKYWNKGIILIEKYQVVFDIWKWLIEEATEKQILSYTDFYVGQNISDLDLPEQQKNLIGFLINRASVNPKNIVQKWSCQVAKKPNWASTVNFNLKQIAKDLHKIKHWKIILGDYSDIENLEATWFIDPPYQFGGEHYIESSRSINFNDLADWCKSRNGQSIVCENSKANWMQFSDLKKIQGAIKKSKEVIWTNYPSSFDYVQGELFNF